jgi:hypothetical protein
MGLEHEAHIGLGQDGQPKLVRRPVGRGIEMRDDGVGPVLTARVAKTAAGDELLALASEGIVRGVSSEFIQMPGGTQVHTVGGRRTRTHHRVGLPGVSLTYRPAYGELAAVLAVRSQSPKETATVPAADPTPVTPEAPPVSVAVTIDADAFAPLVETMRASQDEAKEQITQMRADFEEQMRTRIDIPAPTPVATPPYHLWLQREVYRLTGDTIPADQRERFRTLDDVVASENTGVIPTAYLDDVEGIISFRRPFLESTRQVTDPGGMVIQTARITQHTQAGVQSSEKAQVASRALKTEPDNWNVLTIAGAVDVSLQFIKRGAPAAIQLLDDDMRSQHAQEAEIKALDTLLDQTEVVEGGLLSPSDLELGDAWVNSFEAMNEPPDTLWLSTGALAKFIDAKATASNSPLYGSLKADINAAGGVSGTISGLRVVHVPQMTGVDAIVGPSRAFAWVQDGPIKLSVDNPELAGRDIGYVGFYFFIPRYPAAFTTFGLGS